MVSPPESLYMRNSTLDLRWLSTDTEVPGTLSRRTNGCGTGKAPTSSSTRAIHQGTASAPSGTSATPRLHSHLRISSLSCLATTPAQFPPAPAHGSMCRCTIATTRPAAPSAFGRSHVRQRLAFRAHGKRSATRKSWKVLKPTARGSFPGRGACQRSPRGMTGGHFCLAVFIHSAASPLHAVTGDLDAVCVANQQVAQKNLHLAVPASSPAGDTTGSSGGRGGGGMSRVEFHNPTPEWRTSNLLIDLRRLPQKTRARLDVKGLAPKRVTSKYLKAAPPKVTVKGAASAAHKRAGVYVEASGGKVIEIGGVLLPPGWLLRANVHLRLPQGPSKTKEPRIDVLQVSDGIVVGGSTFVCTAQRSRSSHFRSSRPKKTRRKSVHSSHRSGHSIERLSLSGSPDVAPPQAVASTPSRAASTGVPPDSGLKGSPSS